MNKEVIKAMNKKETKQTFRKWWNKNGYKINRIIFFPIWIFTLAHEKIINWLDNRQKWNEERINKILNYYIPRRAEWDNKAKEFYFFDNGYGWSIGSAKKYLKRKDRRFWKNHNDWYGGKIRTYLIDNFELEGFIKQVIDTSYENTEIVFTLECS